jgi:hypothetical protein
VSQLRNERAVTIVRGHAEVGRPPSRGALEAGLAAGIGFVLSTHRSDSVDMVVDHPLWLACMHAVSDVTQADLTEVCVARRRGLLARMLDKDHQTAIGSLQAYGERMADHQAAEWSAIRWRRGRALVAEATAERWYQVGGPARYHDSYTTRVFVDPVLADALVLQAGRRIDAEGGCVEEIVGLARDGRS